MLGAARLEKLSRCGLHGLLALTAAVVALAGCGGDGGGASSLTPTQELGDDAKMTIQKIWSPNRGAYVECVVITSSSYRARAVAVSCDW